MATKSIFPKNTFNFIRFRRVTGGTVADLPVTEDDPINLVPDNPPAEGDWVVSTGSWVNSGNFWRNDQFWINNP